jgi:hypothetical protein
LPEFFTNEVASSVYDNIVRWTYIYVNPTYSEGVLDSLSGYIVKLARSLKSYCAIDDVEDKGAINIHNIDEDRVVEL